MNRRFIRDTVANDWKPPAAVELERRMKWLDAVETACAGLPVVLREYNLEKSYE